MFSRPIGSQIANKNPLTRTPLVNTSDKKRDIAPPVETFFLLQEDGSLILLEDNSGAILLESAP